MKSKEISGYSIYNEKQKQKIKINTLENLFPKLPNKKYDIIYADPPWDYGGKMQYDRSSIKSKNKGFEKNIFISSAQFKYPTVKTKDLMTLDIKSIANDNCLLFMWTTGPHMNQAIQLGERWGFNYKTVAFVWDKMIHNPGQYTLSQIEYCLIFKKGKIPTPRGVRNARQFFQSKRGKHSEKPKYVIEQITKMFPKQKKIELFARDNYDNWDNWGIEAPKKWEIDNETN